MSAGMCYPHAVVITTKITNMSITPQIFSHSVESIPSSNFHPAANTDVFSITKY